MILEVDPKLNPYSTPIDPLKEPFKEPYLLSPLPLQVGTFTGPNPVVFKALARSQRARPEAPEALNF